MSQPILSGCIVHLIVDYVYLYCYDMVTILFIIYLFSYCTGDSIGGILAYDILCRGHDQHKFGSNSNIPEGEPPSPGQYYRQKSSPGQPLHPSTFSPTSPPSGSPDPSLSSSPNITVSPESTTKSLTSDVFISSSSPLSPPSQQPQQQISQQQQPSSSTPIPSASTSVCSKIVSPQSPGSAQTPLRKISSPLPSSFPSGQLVRKCSAPCSIPGIGVSVCTTLTPSPPGVTFTSTPFPCSSASQQSQLNHHHYQPYHQAHHTSFYHTQHQGGNHFPDILTYAPLCERRGKFVPFCFIIHLASPSMSTLMNCKALDDV